MSILWSSPCMALQLSLPHFKPSLHCPLFFSQSPSPSPHGESLVQQCQSVLVGSHWRVSEIKYQSQYKYFAL